MPNFDTFSDADPESLVGRTLLGRYTLKQVLGRGGMGTVYLAHQAMGATVRKVAVKVLHAELFTDPSAVERFRREAETVVALTHPNTVQFFDFGELENETLFIVMEFLDGDSLADRLKRAGKLPVSQVEKILAQICGSLDEAHQQGIVHRDLKPANILLTQRGGQADVVKVLDFGIAKHNQANHTNLTVRGAIVGTLQYVSPEQILSQPVDARTDVYALSIVLYQLLTGSLPFHAKSMIQWTQEHLYGTPTSLKEHQTLEPLAPHHCEAIMHGLAKEPKDRPPSAGALYAAFCGNTAPAPKTSTPSQPTATVRTDHAFVATDALEPTMDGVFLNAAESDGRRRVSAANPPTVDHLAPVTPRPPIHPLKAALAGLMIGLCAAVGTAWLVTQPNPATDPHPMDVTSAAAPHTYLLDEQTQPPNASPTPSPSAAEDAPHSSTTPAGEMEAAYPTTELNRVIGNHAEAWSACYDRVRRTRPELRGLLMVRIHIAADGRVRESETLSSDLAAPSLETCIHRELQTLQFPAPPHTEGIALAYPFEFAPFE